jgi:hypothetical protein
MSKPHMTSDDPLPADPSSAEPPVSLAGSPERRSFGHKLVIASLVIFAVALALPTIEINLFSKSIFYGIHAAILVFPAAFDEPLSVWPILAVGNIWLFALPIVLRARRSSTVTIASLVTWGVAFAALSLRLQEKGEGLLAGYYVWMMNFFVAAVGATWVALDRSVDSRGGGLA